MKTAKFIWLAGLIVTSLIVIIPVVLFVVTESDPVDAARSRLPVPDAHTDHSALLIGPYETGSDVTRACLTCHEDAAADVMQTTHWTWTSAPQTSPAQPEPVAIGKSNLINNFCIGVQSNWTGCTRCHAGYGWDSADFDFASAENVDCLACHDQSGQYFKADAGEVAEGVDLVLAAGSVARPTRQNCGSCHFNGGGGNAVKHGDLDESLYFPPDALDAHMGGADMQCVDCHQAVDHQIAGRAISLNVDARENQVQCTSCHDTTVHDDARITDHLDALACQTCHVPAFARREATKMEWDWSTAGQDLPENVHEYLKIKGSFVYEDNVEPEYAWFNGYVDRYLLGDPIDPARPTSMNAPLGGIDDATALIWPFKVHRGQQVYDAIYTYFLQPQTVGETGYWTTFDWDSALHNGAEAAGLEYSGQYGFAPTTMYWTVSHMIAPAEDALACASCHGEGGRMDWRALGYPGDPVAWGGRSVRVAQAEGQAQ